MSQSGTEKQLTRRICTNQVSEMQTESQVLDGHIQKAACLVSCVEMLSETPLECFYYILARLKM